MHVLRLAVVAALCTVAACGNAAAQRASSVEPALASATVGAAQPIRHVIFIVQENRSFNNLFLGYPGALTQRYGFGPSHQKVALHSQDLATTWDIDHSSTAFFSACDGRGTLPGTRCRMDGWNSEFAGLGHPANFAYAYVPKAQVAPYWSIARQYVLADHTFSSNLDGSFVAHQYAIAAYASRSVDFPLSAWGCEGGKKDTIATLTPTRTIGARIPACYGNPTLGDELENAGLTWRFYAGAINGDGGLWSSYQAVRAVYGGPRWKADVIDPPAQFLTDVSNGQLATVTWITPTDETSDHPGLNASGGPAWVASLINAVGKSQFWNSSAVFVLWDDWGGWFDPVAPAHADYDGLGFRVPLLMVSPFAKRGYVSHVPYESSSVLRFVEGRFGLAPLAASDARAADPASDAFDFTQPSRPFTAIEGAKPDAYWLQRGVLHARSRELHAIIGDD